MQLLKSFDIVIALDGFFLRIPKECRLGTIFSYSSPRTAVVRGGGNIAN